MYAIAPLATDTPFEHIVGWKDDLIEKLDEAGVPVVFIDFRRDPTANTIPSMLLLGRLLEEEARATEFIGFYVAEMRKVTNMVQSLPVDEKPLVFMENAAGWNPEFCCSTFGSYNYGRFIELAGGHNYGSEKLSGYSSEVSLEGVIAADPDVLLAQAQTGQKHGQK